MSKNLNPDKALIFRIVHVDNVEWILDAGGIDCRNSSHPNPDYVEIGNPDLIAKRLNTPVLIGNLGMLSDYVPFYFTPFSMMMYNIHTGYGGVKKRKNEEIVILVSSIFQLEKLGVTYAYTDKHAYMADAQFFDSPDHLNQIDWKILQERDFQRSDEDPGKCDRYQAEALVYRRVPLEALIGIGCHSEPIQKKLELWMQNRNLEIQVKVVPTWYFSG